MRLPLLLLISLFTVQAEKILRYRCFTDWMNYGWLPVRHVGIEVETEYGYYFIENLGSGTVINPSRNVDCIGDCFDTWWKPSRNTTIYDLKKAGGTGYKMYYPNKNNCYDARDRMLERIGDGEC